jgi:predicted amidohydrolase
MYFDGVLSTLEPHTDLVCLPEMFTTGFSMRTELAETEDGPTATWLKESSLRHGVAICGSAMTREGKRCYNRFYLAQGGEITCLYDKRHLFRMAGEHLAYAAGTESPMALVKGWPLLPRVCYDLRFPVWNRVPQAFVQIYVANWPAPRITAWDVLLKARAIENQCYVLAVNRIGTDGTGKEYPGHSAAIDPKGALLTPEAWSAEGIQYVMLQSDEIENFREKFPVHLDSDHFSIRP